MSNELIIEHDGDTWRVLGTGIDSGNERLCLLASTTRLRWNSTTDPLQISVFVPIAALTAAAVAKPVAAAPAPKPPVNKKLLQRIEQLFTEKLQSKTGWGRNEILALYRDAVSEALMEALDA